MICQTHGTPPTIQYYFAWIDMLQFKDVRQSLLEVVRYGEFTITKDEDSKAQSARYLYVVGRI